MLYNHLHFLLTHDAHDIQTCFYAAFSTWKRKQKSNIIEFYKPWKIDLVHILSLQTFLEHNISLRIATLVTFLPKDITVMIYVVCFSAYADVF